MLKRIKGFVCSRWALELLRMHVWECTHWNINLFKYIIKNAVCKRDFVYRHCHIISQQRQHKPYTSYRIPSCMECFGAMRSSHALFWHSVFHPHIHTNAVVRLFVWTGRVFCAASKNKSRSASLSSFIHRSIIGHIVSPPIRPDPQPFSAESTTDTFIIHMLVY